MSEFISCFACDKEPTQQCPRCGRPYCDDHGDELCDACLEPASGVPSFTLYRGSLLALLFGTLLAVFLLVRPGDTDSDVIPTVIPTTQASTNTTPAAGTTPQAGATQPATTGTQPAGPTATRPAGTTTPGAGTTPAPAGTTNYTVVAGDSLSAICGQLKPASMSTPDCVTQVVSLNGLASDSSIAVGQVLRVPSQ